MLGGTLKLIDKPSVKSPFSKRRKYSCSICKGRFSTIDMALANDDNTKVGKTCGNCYEKLRDTHDDLGKLHTYAYSDRIKHGFELINESYGR